MGQEVIARVVIVSLAVFSLWLGAPAGVWGGDRQRFHDSHCQEHHFQLLGLDHNFFHHPHSSPLHDHYYFHRSSFLPHRHWGFRPHFGHLYEPTCVPSHPLSVEEREGS